MPTNKHRAADQVIKQKLQLERSPLWDDVRDAFLASHPKCAACGETQQVDVHHCFPFQYVVFCGRPDLELDPRNFITLCVRKDCQHHLLLGHLDDWHSYNPRVKSFVRNYAGWLSAKIRADATWKKARAARPKHLDLMTALAVVAFKKMLDRKLPPNPAIVARAAKARKKVP